MCWIKDIQWGGQHQYFTKTNRTPISRSNCLKFELPHIWVRSCEVSMIKPCTAITMAAVVAHGPGEHDKDDENDRVYHDDNNKSSNNNSKRKRPMMHKILTTIHMPLDMQHLRVIVDSGFGYWKLVRDREQCSNKMVLDCYWVGDIIISIIDDQKINTDKYCRNIVCMTGKYVCMCAISNKSNHILQIQIYIYIDT